MTNGDHYRFRAVECHAQAQFETDPANKQQFENLSRAYLRLAIQADRNATIEIYEPPPSKLSDKAELK
jgi:hypothetical protein